MYLRCGYGWWKPDLVLGGFDVRYLFVLGMWQVGMGCNQDNGLD